MKVKGESKDLCQDKQNNNNNNKMTKVEGSFLFLFSKVYVKVPMISH